jgi:hypothetical protein
MSRHAVLMAAIKPPALSLQWCSDMWTRGKDPVNPGKFAVQVYDLQNRLAYDVGWFGTAQEADRAGESYQREILFPSPALTDTDIALIDALFS